MILSLLVSYRIILLALYWKLCLLKYTKQRYVLLRQYKLFVHSVYCLRGVLCLHDYVISFINKVLSCKLLQMLNGNLESSRLKLLYKEFCNKFWTFENKKLIDQNQNEWNHKVRFFPILFMSRLVVLDTLGSVRFLLKISLQLFSKIKISETLHTNGALFNCLQLIHLLR